jgi:putative ABC transport system ATP-binding protein
MTGDLVVSGLTVEFRSGDEKVRPLDGLDLTVPAGEIVLLLGPSGSGKTTLLSCLAGILTPTAGTISFGDLDVSRLGGPDLTRYRRSSVGIVFQAFNLVPSLSAQENVMAPLLAARVRRREAAARATALLEQVGMGDRLDHRPGALSGGQQQRVAIARALVGDPPLLLADEPTAHLDQVQVDGVVALLRSLATPDRVMVVATHDPRMFSLSDRVLHLGAMVAATTEKGSPPC